MDVKIKYLVEDSDRHGNVRLYVRVGDRPKVRIRKTFGTPEFWAEYNAAVDGKPSPFDDEERPVKRLPARKGSLRERIEDYYVSAEFKVLDDSTKSRRRNILDDVCERVTSKDGVAWGEKPFADLEPRHLRKLRDEKSETPETANDYMKAMRQVFAQGVAAEVCERNPAKDVPYLKSNSEGFHTWTVGEVELFEERWPLGTKPRLALALLLYLGGRRSDLVAFGKQHVRPASSMPAQLRAIHSGRWLQYTQHKGRNKKPVTLTLPILPDLETVLAASPLGDMTWLVTEFGKPFSAAGFGNWFRVRCDMAKVPGSAHGLRKAGATIAADNGASDHSLMAIYGWSTTKQANNYTKKANQKHIAGNAMKLIRIERKPRNGTED